MEKLKSFNVRLPKDLWQYIKKAAVDREISMNSLIEDCLIKFKNKREKRFTSDDTIV